MRYRRVLVPGGTYFFTVNLADRSTRLLVDHIDLLRAAVRKVHTTHPFEIVAWVVLPEHLHALWRLPAGDAAYPLRWNLIKGEFSRALPRTERIRDSRRRKRERGIWQRRYWEHLIRDDNDLQRHFDYIHFNPVKHGHVQRVCDWPFSSFHRAVRQGLLPADWGLAAAPAGDYGELAVEGKFSQPHR